MKTSFLNLASHSFYDYFSINIYSGIFYFEKTRSFIFYHSCNSSHYYSILRPPRNAMRIGIVNWKQVLTEYSFSSYKRRVFSMNKTLRNQLINEHDKTSVIFLNRLVQLMYMIDLKALKQSIKHSGDIVCNKPPLTTLTLKFITSNSI